MRTRANAVRTVVVVLATVTAFALSAAACGNNKSNSSSGPRSGVLQFSAPLAGGGEFVGTSLAGRPAVFWFWAPT